jgi:hypothetical protein
MAFNQQSVGNSGGRDFAEEARPGWSVWEDACRSPDSWSWTDQSQISLPHSPTPPKCSTRVIMALINNLGIVYHQYCSSSYLDYFRLRQRKSSSNLIPTRPPELQLGFLRTPTSLQRHQVPSTHLHQRSHFDCHHCDSLQQPPSSGQEKYSPHSQVIYLLSSS